MKIISSTYFLDRLQKGQSNDNVGGKLYYSKHYYYCRISEFSYDTAVGWFQDRPAISLKKKSWGATINTLIPLTTSNTNTTTECITIPIIITLLRNYMVFILAHLTTTTAVVKWVINCLPELSRTTLPPPLKRRDNRSAGYTGGRINIHVSIRFHLLRIPERTFFKFDMWGKS